MEYTLKYILILILLIIIVFYYLINCNNNGFSIGGDEYQCQEYIQDIASCCNKYENNCSDGFPYYCDTDCSESFDNFKNNCSNTKLGDTIEKSRGYYNDIINKSCKTNISNCKVKPGAQRGANASKCLPLQIDDCRHTPDCYWMPDKEQDNCVSKINVSDHPSIKADPSDGKYKYASLCKNLRNKNRHGVQYGDKEIKCNNYYQINKEDHTKKEICKKNEGVGVAPCVASDDICSTCPKLSSTESVYNQMKKCYNSTDPKCKFIYSKISNKCIIDNNPDQWGCWEPSREGETYLLNYPFPWTGKLFGWAAMDSSEQEEICNLYRDSRGLDCEFLEIDEPGISVCKYKSFSDSIKNKWFGETPFCDGECNEEYPIEIMRSDEGGIFEGSCVTGTKVLCAKTKTKNQHNIWCGKAPFCDGECPDGCKNLSVDSFGDGNKCYTGTKVLCDCTDNPNAKCP